jgi:hypothetical protein
MEPMDDAVAYMLLNKKLRDMCNRYDGIAELGQRWITCHTFESEHRIARCSSVSRSVVRATAEDELVESQC